MTDKIIETFSDIHSMVQSYSSGHYIFRGEPKDSFKLRPKFGRSQSALRADCQTIEAGAFDAFVRRGSSYANPFPSNSWEWLAVGQHYGLATRLLDWTENPLVAAFFALNGNHPSDRVIYALDQEAMELANQSQSPFDIDEVVLYEPRHISTRIAAQAGLFTVHNEPAGIFSHPKLDRWIISSKAIIDLNVALDGYGFNQATLFPGLEGIAYHVNDWHLRGERTDKS